MADVAYELVATLALDKSQFEGDLQQTGRTAGSAAAGVATGINRAMNVVGAAVAGATAAVVAFGKSAVEEGLSFDASMSQVAATMGMTVEDLNDSTTEAAQTFAQLSEFAKEMGRTTKFTATQAADALNYMALAGYDAQTSMEMLPTVLNLAAAGNMDLARASDMVTDSQTALGLSLPETMELIDQMARTASKTNTSVEQLGDGILTVGATARNLKGGTVELATVLGVLADNGIKASEGGTHLRNMLLSLQTPTKDGAAALAQLNMTYEDFYDEAGNMRSLPEIFMQLSDAMEGMTQQSKDAIVSGIFNKTDLAAVNAMLGTSRTRFDELAVAIYDSKGAAEEMSKVQLDNLAGDITILQSAFSGLKLEVSDKLTPLIREAMPELTEKVGDLTTKIQGMDFSGVGDAISGLSDKLFDLANYMLDNGDKVISVITGIAEAFVAWKGITAIKEVAGTLQGVFTWLSQIGSVVGAGGLAAGGAIGVAAVGVATVVDYANQLKDIGYLGDGHELQEYADNVTALSEAVTKAKENLETTAMYGGDLTMAQNELDTLQNALIHAQEEYARMAESAGATGEAAEVAGAKSEEAAKKTEDIAQAAEAATQALQTESQNMIATISDTGGQISNEFATGISEMEQAASSEMQAVNDVMAANMGVLAANCNVWGVDMMISLANGIIEGANSYVMPAVQNVAESMSSMLHHSEPDTGPLANDSQWMPDMMMSFAKGIRDNAYRVTNAIKDVFDLQPAISESLGSENSGLNYGVSNADAGMGIGSKTINFNPVINVDGARYNDEQSLAEAIATQMKYMFDREEAAIA